MSIRTERVARLIQRELADIMLSDLSNDVQGIVTLTQVRMTKDLSIAYVYLSILGPDSEQRAVFEHIKSMSARIRGLLGSRIRHQVRKIPDLRFFVDDTLDRAAEIESLFEEIRNSDATTRPSDDNVND
ncbi:MAG: 30S ribosome-binding factor RbfA [Bacteroidetes bacterium]|nr:30S ribosome-binding factor RbfA [Bacteroidota bacterium]